MLLIMPLFICIVCLFFFFIILLKVFGEWRNFQSSISISFNHIRKMFLSFCDLHLVLVPWTEICKVFHSFCSIKCDSFKKGKQDACRLSHSLEDCSSAKLYLSMCMFVCLCVLLLVPTLAALVLPRY